MLYCSHCGNPLPEGATTCPRCGAPVTDANQDSGYNNTAAQPHYQGATQPDADTLSTGGYLLYLCLFSIPLVGFILALIFAFLYDGNQARKRLARAMLLYLLILAVLVLIIFFITRAVFIRPMAQMFWLWH